MRIESCVCDMCGEILSGQKGKAEVKKRYLTINGLVTVDDWDHEFGQKVYFHVTPNKAATMTFCDLQCFDAYMEMRENIWKEKRLQLIREGKYLAMHR